VAIEFLEKSMIVMTNNGGSPSFAPLVPSGGGGNSRHSNSNLSASDGSMTPATATGSGLDERCFLMSLGLDAGSLDLKAESSESDASNMGEFIGD
jgi:hypothetical protein